MAGIAACIWEASNVAGVGAEAALEVPLSQAGVTTVAGWDVENNASGAATVCPFAAATAVT